MLFYCMKCRKNTESKNSKVVMTENGKTVLLKKSKFLKEKEARGFLIRKCMK